MEVAPQIPKNDDKVLVQGIRSSTSLGQDEQMAIGNSEKGGICHGSQMVQKAGIDLSKRFQKAESRIKRFSR